MLFTHNIYLMFNTRRTITIARAVAILSATSTYLLAGLFLNLLVVTGSDPWLCAILAGSTAVWLADAYHSSVADYTVRMTVLGAAYGVAAAGTAVLFG